MNNSVIKTLLDCELARQNSGIELIASENYPSKDILEACGSIAMDKYAEGYPDKRYYGGCEFIDEIEKYAIKHATRLFNVKYANVQPHSGSQANAAAYKALMPDGGKVLSLVLNDGGHLTHGSPVSFSSHQYEFVHYPLGDNGELDYSKIKEIAEKEKPNVILAGYSAYPYEINFAALRNIADYVNAKLMVDMAHIAGLVAAQKYMNPCDYADIVTSTTHKTLRGPRGGLILTNRDDLIKKINSAVFPYYQGGPLMNIIAGKGICFWEAESFAFQRYICHVLDNTKTCCDRLAELGAKVSGTETHLFLLNTLDSYGLTGLEAQKKLESIGITTNKNMLPGDTLKPSETSGLRIGFAAATTRGCDKEEAVLIAELIHNFLLGKVDDTTANYIRKGITSGWKDISGLGGNR